jgi:predicted permease
MRTLRRDRAATLMAVLSLALGIGANVAIFSVAHAYLLRVWQVRSPERLVFVRARAADGGRIDDFSRPLVDRLRLPVQSLESLSAFDESTTTVVVAGEPEIIYTDFVTGDYFRQLDLHMALGRGLTPDDDLPGHPAVGVISHAYWTARFSGDPQVVGRTVVLKDIVCTIVGVTGPSYFGRQTAGRAPALTLPLTWHSALGLKDHLTFELLGRLRADVTPDAARAELDARYQAALLEQGASLPRDGSGGLVRPRIELQSATRGDFDNEQFAREVWILQLVAGVVVLLATVNVASLQLARGAARRRELATRLALGATRVALVRQLLAESLLVATAGGFLGLGLASWVAEPLLALTIGRGSATVPVFEAPILAFTVALIVLTALLCGIVPALRLTRPDHIAVISQSLRTRASDAPTRTSWTLIVSQVALSVVLLIPAGLLVRSVRQLARVDLGFDPTHVIVMSVYPTLAGYEGAQELALYEQLLDRLNTIPGVEAVSFSRYPILRRARTRGLIVHGDRDIVDPDGLFVADAAAPHVFAAIGLRLLAGRDFERTDTAGSERVAVINQAMLDRYFGGHRAVGRSLEFEGVRRQIIGVVSNTRFGLRDEQPAPAVYISYTQAPPDMLGQMWLKIRTTGEPTALIPTIRREILQVAPRLVPAWTDTETDLIASSSGAEASLAELVSASGTLALFLAMVGLYGTMSHAAAQRTREIGVRMALGAQTREVIGMMLRQAGRLVVGGLALGIPCAWLGSRVIASFLFNVGPASLSTTLASCAVVVVASAFAGYFPARRAARVDPVVALRSE